MHLAAGSTRDHLHAIILANFLRAKNMGPTEIQCGSLRMRSCGCLHVSSVRMPGSASNLWLASPGMQSRIQFIWVSVACIHSGQHSCEARSSYVSECARTYTSAVQHADKCGRACAQLSSSSRRRP